MAQCCAAAAAPAACPPCPPVVPVRAGLTLDGDTLLKSVVLWYFCKAIHWVLTSGWGWVVSRSEGPRVREERVIEQIAVLRLALLRLEEDLQKSNPPAAPAPSGSVGDAANAELGLPATLRRRRTAQSDSTAETRYTSTPSTMAAYPPGGTYFDSKKSFADVPVDAGRDNAISTTEFLDAAHGVADLFDVLGSAAFKPVKSDISSNIKKIKERQLAAPMDSENLQDLCRNELKEKKHTATEGLVWLVRGLDFTAQALRQNITNTSDELSTSFRSAYGNTLKPHHSFVIKPIFSAAMSATPYRKDFYAKLGDDQERVTREMGTWLEGLEKDVSILKEFLGRKEAKW